MRRDRDLYRDVSPKPLALELGNTRCEVRVCFQYPLTTEKFMRLTLSKTAPMSQDECVGTAMGLLFTYHREVYAALRRDSYRDVSPKLLALEPGNARCEGCVRFQSPHR